MKKAITKLEDVLTLELQVLYTAEVGLKEKAEAFIRDTDCAQLLEILKKYTESSDHKRLKLERMFSYLMVEPEVENVSIFGKLLDESIRRSRHVLAGKIKTLVLISDFQQLNHFKMTAYKTALMYALEIELETVADLLHQIIEWERKTEKALAELCLKEFSKVDGIQQSACKK